MKHDISPELAAAFTKRAAALGFEIRTAFANSDKKLCLIAYQGQTEVCQFELYGGMRYFPDNPLVVERKQLNALLLDMKQAHDLYADARPFVLRGIHKEDGYRLISEFGDTVLAARMPMGLLPIVHAHGSTVRRVSPINVSVDISCGPDMPVGDIFKP